MNEILKENWIELVFCLYHQKEVKNKNMEVQLSEQNFEKFFSRVNLGARTDDCMDEADLAGAIPKLWSTVLETEYTADLWLSALIGDKPKSMIIEKTDLEKNPGDTIWISRVQQLTNSGELGMTHILEGDEENLDLDYLGLVPSRRGNATCWTKKSAHATAFDLKTASRQLLASWAATKIESILMTALAGATNILWAGVATGAADITQTDTIQGSDLLRLYVSMLNQTAKGITELNDHYCLLLHPLQYFDLMQDASFVNSLSAASQLKTLDIAGYVSSYSKLKIFVTPLLPVEQSEGSPGINIYTGYCLGARSLALAWQQRPSFLTKISSYNELRGVGTDFWVASGILRQSGILAIKSSCTPI